jgi:hypothetical protein
METLTLFLLVVIIAASVILFLRDPKRTRFVQLTEKLPGPFAYPIVGTALPFILASRHSKYDLAYEI